MRRALLSTAIVSVLALHAQIPNPGFEERYTINGYYDPVGYISWNALTTQYGATVCFQGSPGHSGASCIQLTSTFVEGMGTNVPAIATTGDIISNIEGFPCTEQPEQLLGWWKYTSGGAIDQAMVLVVFSKCNSVTEQRDEVGTGVLRTGNVNDWTSFAVPITYSSPPQDPDTCTIILTASGSGIPQPGSTLWVDDLSFDIGTGITDARPTTQATIIDGVLRLDGAQGGRVRVLDALGRELRTATVNTTPFTLDLFDLSVAPILVERVDAAGVRSVMRSMR